jgi:cytoskeletal protein CcmA (bactofilin family)
MNEIKHRRTRDQSSGKATLINEGCKISGEIAGIGDFMVSGQVFGDCDVSGTISVSNSGYWQGSIQADNVIISGHVEGHITANGKVEITSTARIDGTVTGEAIAVAEGAVIEGVMKTTGNKEPVEFVEKRGREAEN